MEGENVARLRPLALDRLAHLADATIPPPINTPLTFADIQRVIATLPGWTCGDGGGWCWT
jgi:hypothetical protein